MCRHIYDWNIVNCDVKEPIHKSLTVSPWQVKTTDVTHGGAATGEYTVRSLSIRQRFGARLLQWTLKFITCVIILTANECPRLKTTIYLQTCFCVSLMKVHDIAQKFSVFLQRVSGNFAQSSRREIAGPRLKMRTLHDTPLGHGQQ